MNKNYFQENLNDILTTYKEFLSFQSISADSAKIDDCMECAKWLQKKLQTAGLEAELWRQKESAHPPVVFAKTPKVQGPTVLIYNHYDVQPVDPISEWNTPPFSPHQEGDKILARGASDNKGQCMYTLIALQAFQKKFPCNLKILIEGEEESGSAHLTEILAAHREEIAADYVMIIDLGIRTPTQPAITLGTRGLLACTLEVESAYQDLHSGCHGGLNYNSLHALVEMLAKARSPEGKVLIPGFYDDIEPVDQELLSELASTIQSNFDQTAYEAEIGYPPTGGEIDRPHLERNWLRPTFEINGIHGGYGGPGSKTVIPARAMAKISCRLVPGQDPLIIGRKIRSFFEAITPNGVKTICTIHDGHGVAIRTKSSSPLIMALQNAMKTVFACDPEFVLEGASIPIAPELQHASGGDVVMWGLGLSSDKIHSPNEEFDLRRMEKGFLTLFQTLQNI